MKRVCYNEKREREVKGLVQYNHSLQCTAEYKDNIFSYALNDKIGVWNK